jgi:putative ABC transport system permease protein
MGGLFRDFRYSIRSLRKVPGFAFIAVSTLALGIAANVIVFSIVDGVILRPLPFKNANQIVIARWRNVQMQPQSEVSAAVFFLLKDHSQLLDSVAAAYPQEIGVNLGGVEASRYVSALRVSESFFRTLGAEPALGRTFSREEDQAGSAGVVILSYGLWEALLNQDREVLGRILRINGTPFTVIGIMPQGFRSYPDADIWMPLQLNPANADAGSDYLVLASPKNGVLIPDAERELDFLLKAYPVSYLPGISSENTRLRLEQLQYLRTNRYRRNLGILFGAVVLVLLAVCTNLATLVLVRGFSRTHELAIRAALGSSRSRLLQLFFIESLFLALLGGVVGVTLAVELLPVVLSFLSADLLQAGAIEVNRLALLFGLAVSLLMAVVISVIPALRVTGTKIQEMLRQAPRGITPSLRQTRSAQVLVGVESALAVILLGMALLLLRSLLDLQRVNPGFNPHQVWVAQLSLAADQYKSTESNSQLVSRITDKLQPISGVEAVGTIAGLPLEKGLNLPIYPSEAPGKIDHAVEYRIVSGDYFKALRIQLVAGRSFLRSDDVGHPVAIINQTLAHKWWPGENAIGHFVRAGEEVGLADRPRQIIGVVADTHDTGLGQIPPSELFVPDQQVPDSITAFVNKLFLVSVLVRTKTGENVSELVRNAVLTTDPALSIASLRPMSQVVTESLSKPIFYAWLTSGFAIFSLLLTSIGIYGLLSYQATLRTPEIGLRLAVGATRFQILLLILRRGAQPSLIGMVFGLISSVFLAKILSGMLYNPHHWFLKLLLGDTLLLGSVAALALLLAAARASTMEPKAILRNQ